MSSSDDSGIVVFDRVSQIDVQIHFRIGTMALEYVPEIKLDIRGWALAHDLVSPKDGLTAWANSNVVQFILFRSSQIKSGQTQAFADGIARMGMEKEGHAFGSQIAVSVVFA